MEPICEHIDIHVTQLGDVVFGDNKMQGFLLQSGAMTGFTGLLVHEFLCPLTQFVVLGFKIILRDIMHHSFVLRFVGFLLTLMVDMTDHDGFIVAIKYALNLLIAEF